MKSWPSVGLSGSVGCANYINLRGLQLAGLGVVYLQIAAFDETIGNALWQDAVPRLAGLPVGGTTEPFPVLYQARVGGLIAMPGLQQMPDVRCWVLDVNGVVPSTTEHLAPGISRSPSVSRRRIA